jgi:hypothetical protein
LSLRITLSEVIARVRLPNDSNGLLSEVLEKSQGNELANAPDDVVVTTYKARMFPSQIQQSCRACRYLSIAD